MEQTMTVQTQAPQQTQSLRKMLGMGQNQAAGDAFSMIFQQMMDGEEMDGDIVEMLMQLFGILKEDSEEMGTQLAAEMMATMPGLMPQDLFAMVQSDAAMMNGAANILAASLNTPQGRAQLPMILAQAEKAAIREMKDGLEDLEISQADREFYQVLKSAWQEEPRQTRTPTMAMDGSNIRLAKELLAKNQKEQKSETLDVESLQADVNARRFMPNAAVGQKAELPVPDAEEIAKQLKSSILDNVARGQNEFLVKLKPEGIGEILVKFSENKDKISLSIFTNDPQTARLISGEVAALQNALKPLNAEVQEITTVTAGEQAAQYSAQNQMTDQGRQFFGQQTSRENHSSRRGGVEAIQEDSFDETVEAGIMTDEALDTYI